ncbi:hypothetical protein IMW82_03495 [Rhodanobacter sp. B2A1Ga4]|uniref:hypothetical protein n=1 Tax=Rhodanobacter sp. B2A1Ga4 TaxID=2778647 RepID=UPI001B364E38|nr:hypothetical protein [Rhodanobacter sp. B2A1Ga4]MBQ4853744.1 hypothetical protein [Rhodanobacter sp. B2A1Ga4]
MHQSPKTSLKVLADNALQGNGRAPKEAALGVGASAVSGALGAGGARGATGALKPLDACQLAALELMQSDTDDRHAGRVPAGDTARMWCKGCGPVWIHPDVAEVLPVVDGWPRALGCPWCFVRKAGGNLPRPSVACEGCRHFTPDTINPAAGMGTCGAGKGMHWPMARHICGNHSTRNPHDQA